MKHAFLVLAAALSVAAAGAHATPPHGGGLPPGLQKKVERGGGLPPGWDRRYAADGYGYQYEYEYAGPYDDGYEPEYVEDRVIQLIRDVRDLAESLGR